MMRPVQSEMQLKILKLYPLQAFLVYIYLISVYLYIDFHNTCNSIAKDHAFRTTVQYNNGMEGSLRTLVKLVDRDDEAEKNAFWVSTKGVCWNEAE